MCADVQVRRAELEAEQKRHDELKRQADAAQERERTAKYQLALAREEERKMVRGPCIDSFQFMSCE